MDYSCNTHIMPILPWGYSFKKVAQIDAPSEIILMGDGSKDRWYDKVSSFFQGYVVQYP